MFITLGSVLRALILIGYLAGLTAAATISTALMLLVMVGGILLAIAVEKLKLFRD